MNLIPKERDAVFVSISVAVVNEKLARLTGKSEPM